MATFEFKFPDVAESIQEGTIVSWKVKVGETVKADQILGEVETAKATVEMPSPKAGKVVKIHLKPGEIIKVGQTMVTLEVAKEEVSPKNDASSAKSSAQSAGGVVGFIPQSMDEVFKANSVVEKKAEQRSNSLATPAIRQFAKQRGVDLEVIKGTGPQGRITVQDIENAKQGTQSESPKISSSEPRITKKYDLWGYIDHLPLSPIRKVIADRMTQSWRIPTVTHADEFDVTSLVQVREKEKETAKKKGVKLTYLAFILKAALQSLKKHPFLNATLDEKYQEIIVKKYYNIGIAVDTPDGLVVPVLKRTEHKDLYTIAKEIEKYADLAAKKKLDLADMKGGSFTITNIGVIGGTLFTPIINAPEVAILGVGKLAQKAVVVEEKVVIRWMLPLVVSFDHRVVDGAEAARFLSDLGQFLQQPKDLL